MFPFPTEFSGGRGSCDCGIPGGDPCVGNADLTVGNAVVVYDRSLGPLWEGKWLGIGGSIDEDQLWEEAGVVVAVEEAGK